ncbi:MAG: hypothetical protein ACXABG_06375 [Promethearchaeota archaeon]|jgi:hypothetical protein
MVQIVITSWWPLHIADKVQKKFNETSKEMGETSSIKSINTYISSCKKGGKVVTYHDIESGKLEEAINFLARFLATYHDIKGFTYEFSFAFTPEDIAEAQQS